MSDNMPKDILPVLITRGVVLFPGHLSTVDAARPMSVAAIEASRDNYDGLIYIVSQRSPEIDDPDVNNDIYKIGTLCRIRNVNEQKGFIRIRIEPMSIFKIINIYKKDESFYVSEGETLVEVLGDKLEEQAIVRKIIQKIEKAPDLTAYFPKSFVNTLAKGISSPELANALSTYLPIPYERKQLLLEELNINERLKKVLTFLEETVQMEAIEKKLDNEVRNNAEKNQKEYYLREKMRAIKTELGEDPNDEKSIENIRKRVESQPYPDFIKAKVKSELKRFEMMPSASLEASLILNYVEWLLETPWFNKTEDNDDLNNVQKILDEDHYGLEEPKKRIVEYLAVKKMTNSLKAPILCFYGPPGCGKTSLGRSIARALGRKYFKVSLGGISDESEIRGHRRTYVGSMPGRIISGMRKSGVTNPVFLLDEVDKLSSSYKGDPASALLEVLDPEQNYAFNDNFLEEPYDLSNVLFIATANQIENVPGPLRDRLELIEVNSYTEIEKYHIAVEHLVPKQIEMNGLKKNQISFTKDAILFIIQRYTREAGVRELERKIGSCVRKAVVELLKDSELKKVKVDAAKVREYLGMEKFDDSVKEKEDQVGVVTGLAYTQFGGDILPIEVTHFKGKGGLVLTGSLGDVMKEYSSIAFDYVKANADKYKIDSKLFMENDVHIHFPEGAVPKDGPSAGVAITLAIISSLSGRKVNANVAMTGEVTLRGKALAIGGLREKTLAATRSGIKTVIIPEENRKNVEDLPKEVKENLDIQFMTCVDDAVKIALRD